jgi:PAS domain S-box-containing protein
MVTSEGTDPRASQGLSTNDRAKRLERQLEAAQQITHIGSWEWDVGTDTVTWSDELYRIYGLEPRSCELTFESFLSRVHPDDREHTKREVQTALQSAQLFEYPERIIRPDGSIRFLETKGEVLRDSAGAPVAMIGTCRDVTEDRAREEQLELHADIVHNVQISLTVWSLDTGLDARYARLVSFNRAAEEMSRIALAANVGRTLSEISPKSAESELPALLAAVQRDGIVRELPNFRFEFGTGEVQVFAFKAFPLPKSCVGLAAEDVTAELRARQVETAEQRIFEMVASGAPLADILERIVIHIEAQLPRTQASILLLDDDGQRLRHGAAPSLPDAYNRAIDGALIGPRAGSCGTAMFRREPVYVSDIETDPIWDDYRQLVTPYGFRACWSTPVLARDGRALGTFALYAREPSSPSEEATNLTARVTRITGIAIERRQLEEQLRALSARAESTREDERTGIAREIHDELGQSLTALKMDVAWLGRRASEPSGVSANVVLDRVRDLSGMIDEIIAQVRHISAELRPGVLDDLGLSAAVEWQAQAFEQRTGTRCAVLSSLDTRPDDSVATAVFRIFQEALTNVTRHAEARGVDVRLERDGDWLTLDVEDDGKGIAPEAARSPKALGILGMHERARRFGGTLSIGPASGGGTALSLRMPLKAAGGAR